MLVMRRLYRSKYVETLFLFSFICLLNHIRHNVIPTSHNVIAKQYKTHFTTHTREDEVLTQKGFFWFCNQNHNFFCSEDGKLLIRKSLSRLEIYKTTTSSLRKARQTCENARGQTFTVF